MIFIRYPNYLLLPTLIQKYDKNHIIFDPVQKKKKKKKRETNWNFTGCQMSHFMIVLIPYVKLSNLSWINKYLFLRNIITKTCLYYFNPLKPHFYIVKLGFTGVYIIFLISAKNIDCGYSLEPPRRGGSNEYPQSMFWAEIWKISEFFIWKFSLFWW